eukprot:scaffold375577_cov17-Prasinocladus_malaysianus.AAC.1
MPLPASFREVGRSVSRHTNTVNNSDWHIIHYARKTASITVRFGSIRVRDSLGPLRHVSELFN